MNTQFIIYQNLLIPVYLLAFIIVMRALRKFRFTNFHSRWSTLIDDFRFSTREFYSLLKEELQSQGITNVKIREEKFKESHLFSSYRLYLRITWKDVDYYLCAAPFGKGFFVSWHLFTLKGIMQRIIIAIPFIGGFLERKFYPTTFYTIDTKSMFMTYAQSAVLKVIDEITNTKGMRISEQDRKPIMKDIFKR